MRRRVLLLVTVATGAALFAAPVKRTFDTWRQAGGGGDSSQYSSLKQINKSNVKRLQVAWTYPTNANRFNPIVVDGVMYVSANGKLAALDAATGKEMWTQAVSAGARGINYWESKDRSDRRLVITGAGLKEIDARTGEPIAAFGQNGVVNMGPGLDPEQDRTNQNATANPGRVIGDIIIVPLPAGGASYEAIPGDVHGYDVKTGKLVWVFHTVPHPGEFGYDTWPPGLYRTAGGVHNWNEMSVDEDRGIAYVPLGTARFDFYGGNRPGNNLYGNSLVALDAKTGKRLWHFQTVHHDLWDYDLPAAPKLLTVRHNGRNVDAVAQPTKQGFLFVFDRSTGDPLWPIEEKPVPQTDVPGEHSAPTQPFPTAPPPFARQSFTEKDINPYLPEEERNCIRELLRESRNEGLFTPPSIRGTIQLPGNNGGANWGSSAVDPNKGTMYIVSKELPMGIKLNAPGANSAWRNCNSAAAGERRGGGAGAGGRGAPGAAPERGAAGGGRGPAGGARGGGGGAAGAAPATAPVQNTGDLTRYTAPYQFFFGTSLGLSIIGPPWSQLTAYDLNAGRIFWQVPNGSVPGLPDSNTGSQFPRGGVVVTAGGLVFVATPSDRKLRAYDQDNGKVVWEYDLPNVSEGVPTVYEVGGREYLALTVAGGQTMQPRSFNSLPPAAPGAYMVFALPK